MRTNADQLLAEAAKAGDAERAHSLIEAGADIESRHEVRNDHGAYFEDLTPLMIACWSSESNVETVQILLDLGAELNAVSNGEVSAIWYAAGGGDDFSQGMEIDHPSFQERLLALFEAGASLARIGSDARPIMAEAARIGDPERIRILMEAGADTDPHVRSTLRDDTKSMMGLLWPVVGRTTDWTDGPDSWTIPLFAAAQSGDEDSVVALLEAGADPKVRSSDGKTVLCFAKTPEILKILVDAGAPVAVVKGWSNELNEAFSDERYDVAEALIDATGGLEMWGDPGEILDRYVGVNVNPAAVRLLIQHGAPLDHPSENGGTLLHVCAWQGDSSADLDNEWITETMQILIDSGLDVNARDENGRTALHEAVSGDWGSATAARSLLAAGAEPDVRDEKGSTPLMMAANMGQPECVPVLLELGADPRLKRGLETTALTLARRHRDRQVQRPRIFEWAFTGFLKLATSGVRRRFGGEPADSGLDWDEINRDSLEKADRTIALLQEAITKD